MLWPQKDVRQMDEEIGALGGQGLSVSPRVMRGSRTEVGGAVPPLPTVSEDGF